jgi:hypothetical protein
LLPMKVQRHTYTAHARALKYPRSFWCVYQMVVSDFVNNISGR